MTVSWSDRILEAGVLVLLVVTPLAFGTVEPWSEALAELVILGMAVTYVVRNLREWEFRVDLSPGRLPAAQTRTSRASETSFTIPITSP